MHFLTNQRPLRGAFFACALLLAPGAWAQAVGAAGSAASSPEQLRVHGVADQLIGYLGQTVRWAEEPATRVPLGQIKPAIQSAVGAHPEVRLAQEQQQTASFATREAFAGFLPQVSANVDAGNRQYDAVNRPWAQIPAYKDDSKSFGVTARQLLYDFGAVSGRVDAQTARESAAAARAEARRSELALRALTVWHELVRAQQQLRLAEENRLARQQIMNFIAEREQLGGSSQSDVLRARARLADAQAIRVAMENRLKAAEAAYREIFNADAPADLVLPQAMPVENQRYTDINALIERNALLAQSLAQGEAARLEAKSAAAALLPSFHLEVSTVRRDIAGPGVPGVDTTYGVVARHNLYAGGAEIARQQQAEQRAAEARHEADNLRRQLERAIAQALADLRNSDPTLAARKDALKVAASAFESVREQFAFRRGTLLDLLRSQEELYLAGRDMVDGLVDHALARWRLLHLAMELPPMFDLGTLAR